MKEATDTSNFEEEEDEAQPKITKSLILYYLRKRQRALSQGVTKITEALAQGRSPTQTTTLLRLRIQYTRELRCLAVLTSYTKLKYPEDLPFSGTHQVKGFQ